MRQRQTCSMERTSLFNLMSKNYHGEAAKFVELSWFCSIDKQSRLAEQLDDAHVVGKSKRDDEHLLGLAQPEQVEDKPELKGGTWSVSMHYGVVFGS